MASKTKKYRGQKSPAKARDDQAEELRQQQEKDLEERLKDYEAPENPEESVNARTGAEAEAERHREDAQKDMIEGMQEAASINLPAGYKPPKAPSSHKGGRFVLLSGSYQDLRIDSPIFGVTFDFDKEKETVVESDLDLDVLFANKFRRLEGPTAQFRDYRETFSRGNTDRPLAERVPHGMKTAFVGDADEVRNARELAASRQPQKGAKEPPPAEEEEEEQDLGDDVTDQFEDAESQDCKVYKGEDGYCVTDADGEPIDGGEFTKKSEVKKFLKDRASEE